VLLHFVETVRRYDVAIITSVTITSTNIRHYKDPVSQSNRNGNRRQVQTLRVYAAISSTAELAVDKVDARCREYEHFNAYFQTFIFVRF